jgi:hypothetical protein
MLRSSSKEVHGPSGVGEASGGSQRAEIDVVITCAVEPVQLRRHLRLHFGFCMNLKKAGPTNGFLPTLAA